MDKPSSDKKDGVILKTSSSSSMSTEPVSNYSNANEAYSHQDSTICNVNDDASDAAAAKFQNDIIDTNNAELNSSVPTDKESYLEETNSETKLVSEYDTEEEFQKLYKETSTCAPNEELNNNDQLIEVQQVFHISSADEDSDDAVEDEFQRIYQQTSRRNIGVATENTPGEIAALDELDRQLNDEENEPMPEEEEEVLLDDQDLEEAYWDQYCSGDNEFIQLIQPQDDHGEEDDEDFLEGVESDSDSDSEVDVIESDPEDPELIVAQETAFLSESIALEINEPPLVFEEEDTVQVRLPDLLNSRNAQFVLNAPLTATAFEDRQLQPEWEVLEARNYKSLLNIDFRLYRQDPEAFTRSLSANLADYVRRHNVSNFELTYIEAKIQQLIEDDSESETETMQQSETDDFTQNGLDRNDDEESEESSYEFVRDSDEYHLMPDVRESLSESISEIFCRVRESNSFPAHSSTNFEGFDNVLQDYDENNRRYVESFDLIQLRPGLDSSIEVYSSDRNSSDSSSSSSSSSSAFAIDSDQFTYTDFTDSDCDEQLERRIAAEEAYYSAQNICPEEGEVNLNGEGPKLVYCLPPGKFIKNNEFYGQRLLRFDSNLRFKKLGINYGPSPLFHATLKLLNNTDKMLTFKFQQVVEGQYIIAPEAGLLDPHEKACIEFFTSNWNENEKDSDLEGLFLAQAMTCRLVGGPFPSKTTELQEIQDFWKQIPSKNKRTITPKFYIEEYLLQAINIPLYSKTLEEYCPTNHISRLDLPRNYAKEYDEYLKRTESNHQTIDQFYIQKNRVALRKKYKRNVERNLERPILRSSIVYYIFIPFILCLLPVLWYLIKLAVSYYRGPPAPIGPRGWWDLTYYLKSFGTYVGNGIMAIFSRYF